MRNAAALSWPFFLCTDPFGVSTRQNPFPPAGKKTGYFSGTLSPRHSYNSSGVVSMKCPVIWLLLLLTAVALHAQDRQGTRQQKFISGGSIRMHLESGGYTIGPSDSDNIVVTWHARSEGLLRQVKVEINPSVTSADVYVRNTPHNNFQATIEVPRHSNLWVRLSAGEVEVDGVEGDKNIEVMAGQIVINVPHPELYGHRDASVTTGSIEAPAFDVSKGGLFRSFEQSGPGKYRLHAHVMTGEVDLRSSD